jgi:thiol-disulfide isomerase/thioredoxin
MKELVVDEQLCATQGDVFAGGQELFDVFADHFSWSYAPIREGQGTLKLPVVKGPLTLIFDEAGKLVFSAEGAIGDTLSKRMQNDRLASRAKGPDHPLFGDDFRKTNQVPTGAPVTFSNLRTRARYTVVMFWNTWCSSCVEELYEWHKEQDSAYKFCAKQPDFCQVLALETGRAESGQSPKDYFAGLVNGNDDFDGWLKRRWTMPLAVEDIPLADGRAPMGWFAGWIKARFGSSDPRVVIYDKEGKVVGHWRSLPGEHGPRDTLKSIFERGE